MTFVIGTANIFNSITKVEAEFLAADKVSYLPVVTVVVG
jgi:hypothetical protein